ncbi:MAG TPA: hypothetical protein VNO26_14535 [Candidatus Limnocylindria bacterium]|nr:hypothetical protein [Candidatus Limnocylindria bacterium]
MPHRDFKSFVLLAMLAVGWAAPATAAPPFELVDDGATFIYRARPGESPMSVAKSFGIPEDRIDDFLVANGIRDPTRVPLGFAYRVPNPLAPRVDELTDELAALRRSAAEHAAETTALRETIERLRGEAAFAADKEARLHTLEARWPIALTALVVALLGLAGALWTARLALGRLQVVERRASALAHELEDRRRAVLAERQEASHRILELENRVRQLECQPRLVGGRG